MAVEIITKEDLQNFKQELLKEIQSLMSPPQSRQYLQSAQVRKLLGISPGTLQHLRITGQLPYTKVGGKMFYQMDDIQRMMEGTKS
jgi:Helix-turn-helix domain